MVRFQALFPLLLFFTKAFVTTQATRVPAPRLSCGKSCRFVICGFQRAIMSNPRLPITRPICTRRNKRIGQILSVGEAKITLAGKKCDIRISRLLFNGITPYPADFVFAVRAELTLPDVSSLAVKSVRRRAMEHLQGACMMVPITKWVERGVERSGRQCVAFRVEVPVVVVEVQWDSNDDLDLFVTEPDGTKVLFQDGGGGSGRLLRDVGRRSCNIVKRVGGKETIVYYANQVVKRGRYSVSVEHTKNCKQGATKWELRVVVKGRLRKRIRGVTRLRESSVIRGSETSFVV